MITDIKKTTEQKMQKSLDALKVIADGGDVAKLPACTAADVKK